jgi:hypothetical protein
VAPGGNETNKKFILHGNHKKDLRRKGEKNE